MLKLKDVSKYYYNKGNISCGFTKINLSFNVGEFVAITGESGSGKSTLLNVLSGLDSYEEGEMYIDNKETSHYTQKDYEIYRKKYVSNIFQSFNLVNSYTVYQNIELALLLNGYKKKEVKDKVNALIKKVGLINFKNTKVSKLSGGQKQRTCIARALAYDTPVILADEPTGNLDKKNSEDVLSLLAEISNDKLVIIVSHNYDQIEKYVTRKITMHDGKVTEDKIIKQAVINNNYTLHEYKEISFINKILLGIRNTFNIIPKFILLLFVYLFVIYSFVSSYGSFNESLYDESAFGYNQFFNEISDKRIVINKKDKTSITDEDYDNISKIDNVNYIVKNDLLLDSTFSLYNDNVYFTCLVRSINDFDGKIDEGNNVVNDNDIIINISKDNYYNVFEKDTIISTYEIGELGSYSLNSKKNNKYEVNLVGISYKDIDDDYDSIIYVSDKIMSDIMLYVNKNYTTIEYKFLAGKENVYSFLNTIVACDKVPEGKYIISEDYTYSCTKNNCNNNSLHLYSSNIYYSNEISLSYYKYYNKNNMNTLLGYNYDDYNGSIFVNTNDYNKLFNSNYYQSSIYIKDVNEVDSTLKSLDVLGFKSIYIKDTLTNYMESEIYILKIIKTVVLSLLLIVLFFISYFVIKIILKSRNIYFATLRILGSSYNSLKDILSIELFSVSNIAYILFIIFMYFFGYKFSFYEYIKFNDYLFIYLIIIFITVLISNRFSRKIFKTSSMSVYREEV